MSVFASARYFAPHYDSTFCHSERSEESRRYAAFLYRMRLAAGSFDRLRVTGYIFTYLTRNIKSGRSKPLPYVKFADTYKLARI